MIDHHTALIYTMVLISAADRNMTDAELGEIGEMVKYLPVFKDYDDDKLTGASEDCAELLTVSLMFCGAIFGRIRHRIQPGTS